MKLEISFNGNSKTIENLFCRDLSFGERFKNASKFFSLYLLIGLICILVPILHFVLVPAFLLVSFIVSYRRFKEVKSVNLSPICCPLCESQLKLGMIKLPNSECEIRKSCNNCGANLSFSFTVVNSLR